jgi:tetratricopeptide (TPR) repeat protein
MAIKTKICSKCGTSYQYDDDFFAPSAKCPTCYTLEQQEKANRETQERQREAQERDLERIRELEEERATREREALEEQRYIAEQLAEEQRRAAEVLAEEQRRIARDSWKIQAQGKVTRAFELLNAELFEEAILLLQEALKEDPGNLEAYQGIAKAYHQTGQEKKSIDAIKKQLLLLNSMKYNPLFDNYNQLRYDRILESILATQSENLWGQISDIMVNNLSLPINPVVWLVNHNEIKKARSLYDKIVASQKPLASKYFITSKEEDIAIISGVLLLQPDAKQWTGFITTTAKLLYDPFHATSWLLDQGEVEKACSLYDSRIALFENYRSEHVLKELKLLLGLLTASASSNLEWNSDNQVWKSYLVKTIHWNFEPSHLLYEILDIAPQEAAKSLFDTLKTQGKISQLLGITIGIYLKSERADEMLVHYLQDKNYTHRNDVIDEFIKIKSGGKISGEILAKVRQSILDWYERQKHEINKEFNNQASMATKKTSWIVCIIVLGITISATCIVSSFIPAIDDIFYFQKQKPAYMEVIQIIICFFLPLIVGGTIAFQPFVRKHIDRKNKLSELWRQEKALLEKILPPYGFG